jgi:hypothetical protein
MKPVLADASLHIVTTEPDRTTASKRRIACREDDLLVGPHAQNFVRLDERSGGKLFRARAR